MTTPFSATATWLRRFGPPADPVIAPWVRLVCFPHAGGTAAFFWPWRKFLPPDVELYGVQYPGRLDRIAEPCLEDMATLVEAVTEAVAPLTDRPVVLFGHSMGAIAAYEVARRLHGRHGRSPSHLFASARCAPQTPRAGTMHLAGDDVLWEHVRRLNGTRAEVLADPAVRAAFLPAVRGDYRLIERYRPLPGGMLDCPVTVVIGTEDGETDRSQAGQWAGATSGEFTVREFPGDHFYLVGQLAALVDEILRRVADHIPPRQPLWAGP